MSLQDPFFNTSYITLLVQYLALIFSGASGSAQEKHLRVCFLSRRDKTFSSLMDMLLKSLPLVLPQKDHLVLAANFATLGLMLARILASPAGKKSSRWQSCVLLCVGKARSGWLGWRKQIQGEQGPVSVIGKVQTQKSGGARNIEKNSAG